ncbi:MAG TPA: PEP-CTERM sorting domain-containing protein [Opitutales bacterium]|nr:PEP-CTERM sorting domain-containing protein [Opitutales bacterium]
MKTLPSLLVTTLFLLVSATTASAAVVSIGTTAPTEDGADLSTFGTGTPFLDWGSSVIWGDRPARGQTFSLASGTNYELNSITIQSGGNQNSDFSDFNIRVGSVSGTDFTAIRDEDSGAVTDNVATDDYVTFTFDSAVTLTGGVLYGWDIGLENSGGFNPYNTDGGSVGGNRYDSGTTASNGVGDSTISTYTSGNNRLFHADITAVPEPSSFALIAGFFGLTWVMLRRRY